MQGSEIEAYTRRSNDLATLCPNLSRPLPRRIELYLKGLAPAVKGYVTAANLDNLPRIVRLAHKITDQEVESGNLPPRVSATTSTATATTPASDNKRKWNDTDKATSASQPQKRPETSNNRSFSQSSSVNQGPGGSQNQGSYVGKKPQCSKCGYHHYGQCVRACRRCEKLNQNANGNNRQNNNSNAGNNNNNGNNGGSGARGRVFMIGAEDARNDGNVVTEFSQRLGSTPTPLEVKQAVELADGKMIEASHVHFGCKLDLVGQIFDIDLLPITLGSFDIVVGMDWLSKHQAEILCKEKIVRIPIPEGEPLLVQGHRSGAMVGIISAMQVQKCLRKGYPSILTLVTDTPSEERKIEDLPVVREFADVFPEELPGLPPHHQVEFQIELAPGAAPIARAPYRLAPGELQELSNQLQKARKITGDICALSWNS
ncbi:uncharacterized protein LOC110899688 [Helianthus annuus]|uniref:uncharacterized protein LOC110899688 n=1 Tax=Helianthus annuus TaxID=4232 RepID=UPI000B8FB36C|nr:uncharacterized protein LOC110899688 [Helianthus annuus]